VATMNGNLTLSAQAGLEWYNASSLKTMLRWRTDRWRDAKAKAEVLSALQTHLFDPSSIRSALASCDPITREALAQLQRKGGAMPVAALCGQLVVWHPDLKPAQVRAVPSELVRRALAFWHTPAAQYNRAAVHDVQRPATDNVHATTIFSAPEILEYVVVPPGLGEVYLTPRGRADVTAAPAQWQRLVLGFLRAIEDRAPRILQSGVIGSRDREALAQAVGLTRDVPDAPRLSPVNFYRATLAAAGLLEVSGERQLRTTSAALHFVSLSPMRQAQALLGAWIEAGENELLALGHLHCERHANVPKVVPNSGRLGRAHRVLVDLLRQKVQPGQWYSLADVSRSVRYQDVEFLVSWLDPAPYRWSSYEYYYDRDHLKFPPYPGVTLEEARGRSRALVMGEDWDLVEGAFIRAVFHGPLTWLGLVECQVRPGGKDVFALTPLGAQALELEGSAVTPDLAEIPSHRDALIVQPNFDVVVYAPEERTELLYHIDRFAERVSADRLAIYRLTNASICEGLQLGLCIDDVIALLEGAARTPLPQNVVFSLRDWARRFEEVHWIKNAWLLEAPDEATLDRWLSDPTVGTVVERRISPMLALCAGQRPATLSALLADLGASVQIVDANAPLISCGRADGVTGLSIPAADANLYLRRALADVAEFEGEDQYGCRYRITPQTIGRAAKGGKTANEILGVVESVIHGAVPSGMQVRIKGWAGAYGAVALGPVGIVVAPSPEALRELRADPAFASAFILSVSATAAIVDLDALDVLEQAFAERGIATTPYDFQTVRLI